MSQAIRSDSGGDRPVDDPGMQPIDLLLRQGEPAELEAFRDEIAADPLLALEVADTVALLERLRGLRVEPDPEFAGKLAGVVRRAARQLPPEPNRAAPWLAAAAIAAVTFFTAAWFDPLRLHARPAAVVAATSSTAATAVAPSAALAVLDVPTTADIAHQDALGTMRRRFELERATELSAALENAIAAEQAGSAAALRRWLDPKNALAVLHLDHELRSRVDVRRAALVSEGAMLAADERVQHLADGIAAGIDERVLERATAAELALGVRALVAAGASTAARRGALATGTRLLAQRLPQMAGEERVQVLLALIEAAAVERLEIRGLKTAGDGFVDEILRVDEETWERRRPDLLTGRVAAASLGDAGRALALLPAFGVAADRSAFVRRLVLGQLRERREHDDRPEVLAAMLYGFGDLLSEPEVDRLVRELRRWKPAHLAPDFVTVQQIAWAVEPGRVGFTLLQRDLRSLVILPDPDGFGERAALCMCLATNYAAHRRESLERFVLGE